MGRLAVCVIIGGVVVISVFAALGSPAVFAVYAVAVGVTGGVHWVRGCMRCTNFACAINPRSPEFVFASSKKRAAPPPEVEGFSDLDSARLAIPVLLALLVGLYGAWLFHPLTVFAALALIAVGLVIYNRHSCRECANDCPANRNPAYHAWKSPS